MKEKIIGVLLLLNLFALFGYAQKEGNNWCFPDSAGINFNDTAHLLTFTSQIGPHALLNQTTISDPNGNLFCYTGAVDFAFNGLYVWNRNHMLMPHGSRLQGHTNHISLLLPVPDIDSLIFVLHIGRDSIITDYFRLFYSAINKNLDGGLGDVTIRDSLVYYGKISDEKLAAVKHANGRDWWVFIYDYDTGKYIYFLVTPSGISYMGIQNIGSNGRDLYYGKLIFSNDGTKMMGVGAAGHIDVFDFDRCTGTLSNYHDIGEHLTSESYQYAFASFSPDGNVIYVAPFNLTKNFYQFNLNASNITASKINLNSYPDTGLVQWTTYESFNLAPDGKIYVPISTNYQGSNTNTYFTQHLDVIEHPDSVGTGCNYIRQAFDLGGHFVAGGLPNMPYYGLGALTGSICDSIIGTNDLTQNKNGIDLFPNPSSGIFTLQLNDVYDKIVSISVEDLLGNKILSFKRDQSFIDLHSFADGIYIVHVQTQKHKLFSAKIIKR